MMTVKNWILREFEFTKNRNIAMDALKGISIFLVILGHCGWLGSESIAKFAQAFYMPLFMLISGYFIYNSLQKRTIVKQWIHWAKTLLLPLFIWILICLALVVILSYATTETLSNIDVFIKSDSIYWFIGSLLLCGMITTLIKFVFKDNTVVFIFITSIVALSSISGPLYLGSLPWMLPFFVGGYLLHKHQNLISRYLKVICAICLFAFPLLLLTLSNESMSYIPYWTVHFSEISNGLSSLITAPLDLNLIEVISHNFRYIMLNFCGCGVMYCCVKLLSETKYQLMIRFLALFGIYSLFIYFIQKPIIEITIHYYLPNFYSLLSSNWIIGLLFVLASLIFFTIVGSLVKRNKVLGLLLMGGR